MSNKAARKLRRQEQARLSVVRREAVDREYAPHRLSQISAGVRTEPLVLQCFHCGDTHLIIDPAKSHLAGELGWTTLALNRGPKAGESIACCFECFGPHGLEFGRRHRQLLWPELAAPRVVPLGRGIFAIHPDDIEVAAAYDRAARIAEYPDEPRKSIDDHAALIRRGIDLGMVRLTPPSGDITGLIDEIAHGF